MTIADFPADYREWTPEQRERVYELAEIADRCPALKIEPGCPGCRTCAMGRGEIAGRPRTMECLVCVESVAEPILS